MIKQKNIIGLKIMKKLDFRLQYIQAIISPSVDLEAFISQRQLADSNIACNNLALDVLKTYQHDFNLSSIPPLERRRLSNASKCAFSLLGDKKLDSTPIVFSSCLGEINRCFSMLLGLQNSYLLSPTSFSLSVLNATPALLAIANNNNAEISAISANPSLEYAIINAYTKLQDYKEVLVLSYYEGLCDEYLPYKAKGQNKPPLQCVQHTPKNVPPFLMLALLARLQDSKQTNDKNNATPYNATLEINHHKNTTSNGLQIVLSELDLLNAINALENPNKNTSTKGVSYEIINDSISFKWHIQKAQ